MATLTTYACSNNMCVSTQSSITEPCERETDLDTCNEGVCQAGVCCRPQINVDPSFGYREQTTFLQTGRCFSPNTVAVCTATNSTGSQTFNVSINSLGQFSNPYMPSAGAGLGLYELFCEDARGLRSNLSFFTIGG